MGRLNTKIDYETLRNARILENQARLESLGLQKTISELRSLTAETKKTQKKQYVKQIYDFSNLRRSNRLKEIAADPSTPKPLYCFRRRRQTIEPILRITWKGDDSDDSEDESPKRVNRRGNAPVVRIQDAKVHALSPEASARRCESKGRGSIYDPVYGICCHFCRQKKLCGEEDCKRCGNLDVDQPCIGKTDCSVCHSTNGVLCRACLKVRYGEEMEEVREKKEWMCPHCIEEKGINPYWICNSSFCLKKRKLAPTGIAIYRAREMGYESVAHLLMDELQRRKKLRSQ
ncbi:uncharacterized protein LOC126669327 [Mercurialis annua]|uniref:uncharacterized protein LOC126669327 n=1 Tax=Mercurialis annua TaxID=3986 RepID=UPI0021605409|nr:uncharacterized protein LOC126669327 [Mercurialis annua]